MVIFTFYPATVNQFCVVPAIAHLGKVVPKECAALLAMVVLPIAVGPWHSTSKRPVDHFHLLSPYCSLGILRLQDKQHCRNISLSGHKKKAGPFGPAFSLLFHPLCKGGVWMVILTFHPASINQFCVVPAIALLGKIVPKECAASFAMVVLPIAVGPRHSTYECPVNHFFSPPFNSYLAIIIS